MKILLTFSCLAALAFSSSAPLSAETISTFRDADAAQASRPGSSDSFGSLDSGAGSRTMMTPEEEASMRSYLLDLQKKTSAVNGAKLAVRTAELRNSEAQVKRIQKINSMKPRPAAPAEA